MKTIALILSSVALCSCGLHAPPEWDNTPNPLDTPETFVVRPESMGRFGPHSEFYNNVP